MVRRSLLLIGLLASLSYADTGYKDTIRVTETDNSPVCTVGELIFSAGSVTCAGQRATIASGGGSGGLAQGIILSDGAGLWKVTVGTSGSLITTSIPAALDGYIRPSSFVLQDASFALWTITINSLGNLVTTLGGSGSLVINDVLINDTNKRTWNLSVNTLGNLVTS